MPNDNRESPELASRRQEAEEVGCYGLFGRIARNLRTHEEWSADEARKADGPFYCPACFSDAVLRKCAQKVDHFAHRARLSPVLGPKEKTLHDACTAEICGLMQRHYPEGKWAVERPIQENKARKIRALVPDISGRIDGTPVAIEVQLSALTIPRIVQRTTDYAKRGIALVWIVPLHEPLGDVPFRPRLYERYLHSIYFGRTYYWWSGKGLSVTPVHYGPASRHIEYREWIEDGEEQSAGGFSLAYKIIKTPIYATDLDLRRDFVSEARGSFTPENERKEVPACRIWRDTLAPWW